MKSTFKNVINYYQELNDSLNDYHCDCESCIESIKVISDKIKELEKEYPCLKL